LLRSCGGELRKIVTDKLRSHGVAHRELVGFSICLANPVPCRCNGLAIPAFPDFGRLADVVVGRDQSAINIATHFASK
jgi:hypothetical protein